MAETELTVDLDEQLFRIRRMGAETDKFIAELHKLRAEEDKFWRNRTATILTAGAALLSAGAVLGGVLVRLLGR